MNEQVRVAGARLRGWPTVFAFAILPPLGALLGYILFPAMWRLSGDPYLRDAWGSEAALQFALITAIASVFVTCLGAVPLVLVLAERGKLSIRNAAIAGALLGNAPFAAYVCFIIPFAVQHVVAGTMRQHLIPLPALLLASARMVVLGSTIGVVSGLVFYWLGVHHQSPATTME